MFEEIIYLMNCFVLLYIALPSATACRDHSRITDKISLDTKKRKMVDKPKRPNDGPKKEFEKYGKIDDNMKRDKLHKPCFKC